MLRKPVNTDNQRGKVKKKILEIFDFIVKPF